MANETQTISKLIITIGGTDYELDGGGGSGPLGPNTVGTEQIIDGAVEMEDLHEDVVGKIQKTYDEDDETLHMDFDVADVNNSNHTQEAGAGSGSASGGGAELPDE